MRQQGSYLPAMCGIPPPPLPLPALPSVRPERVLTAQEVISRDYQGRSSRGDTKNAVMETCKLIDRVRLKKVHRIQFSLYYLIF